MTRLKTDGSINQLINILKSFFTDRNFHIKIDENKLTFRKNMCRYTSRTAIKTALFTDNTLFYATSNSNDTVTKSSNHNSIQSYNRGLTTVK